MRDNERILQIIGESQSFMRTKLSAMLEADASPETLRCFVECLQQLECSVNSLSDGFTGSAIVHGFGSAATIRGIAVDAIDPVARSLDELTKRIEQSLEMTRNAGSEHTIERNGRSQEQLQKEIIKWLEKSRSRADDLP